MHARAVPALTESTIRTSDDILSANESGEIHEAQSNEFGMLDDIRRVTDYARYQYLALGKLDIAPDFPFVLMAGIARFDGVSLGMDLEQQLDDIPLQRSRVVLEPVPADEVLVVRRLISGVAIA